eukprot:1539905-Rhodomonas_salina.1
MAQELTVCAKIYSLSLRIAPLTPGRRSSRMRRPRVPQSRRRQPVWRCSSRPRVSSSHLSFRELVQPVSRVRAGQGGSDLVPAARGTAAGPVLGEERRVGVRGDVLGAFDQRQDPVLRYAQRQGGDWVCVRRRPAVKRGGD